MRSLQDQLLKAGLVTEEQLETARAKPAPSDRNRHGKGKGKGKGNPKGRGKGRGPGGRDRREGTGSDRTRDNAKAKTANGDAKKGVAGKSNASGRDRSGQLSPEERALRDKVHGLIRDNSESREEGETAYHFVKGSRIKRIYVTESQRDRLSSNELTVAAMKGKHFLIPMTVANEIKALIPGYYIAMGSVDTKDTDEGVIDDEYSDYQVPDDLMW